MTLSNRKYSNPGHLFSGSRSILLLLSNEDFRVQDIYPGLHILGCAVVAQFSKHIHQGLSEGHYIISGLTNGYRPFARSERRNRL